MWLVVVTPRGTKVDAQVTMVTVPGSVGELGILPGHRPLITSLAIGILNYQEAGKTKYLAVNGGFMEVHEDRSTLVTETAETPDEIDAERAKKSLEAAEVLVRQTDKHTDPVGYKQAQEKRQRALNRLAATRYATPEALKREQARAAG